MFFIKISEKLWQENEYDTNGRKNLNKQPSIYYKNEVSKQDEMVVCWSRAAEMGGSAQLTK